VDDLLVGGDEGIPVGVEDGLPPVSDAEERVVHKNPLPFPGFQYNRTIVLLLVGLPGPGLVSQKVGKSSLTARGKRG
jgi:hypothetical protein